MPSDVCTARSFASLMELAYILVLETSPSGVRVRIPHEAHGLGRPCTVGGMVDTGALRASVHCGCIGSSPIRCTN